MSADQRARLGQALRRRGFRAVWGQVDRAGLMDPVEEGMFLLDRLYPDMPAAHRASLGRQLQTAYDRDEWHGFARPQRTRRKR